MVVELAPRAHETLGINVSLGRTIIIASFLLSHSDPTGSNPNIDLTEKKRAAWLTTPKIVNKQNYDLIIGPDGNSSQVAVFWKDGKPEIYFYINDKMTPVEEVQQHDKVTFSNVLEGTNPILIFKTYLSEILKECYTVMRLPEKKEDYRLEDFSTSINRNTLVSGMKNRGLSSIITSLLAVRLTRIGHLDLPFGREI